MPVTLATHVILATRVLQRPVTLATRVIPATRVLQKPVTLATLVIHVQRKPVTLAIHVTRATHVLPKTDHSRDSCKRRARLSGSFFDLCFADNHSLRR